MSLCLQSRTNTQHYHDDHFREQYDMPVVPTGFPIQTVPQEQCREMVLIHLFGMYIIAASFCRETESKQSSGHSVFGDWGVGAVSKDPPFICADLHCAPPRPGKEQGKGVFPNSSCFKY